MTGCKIGKIKMKHGGAEIRIFENKKYIENDTTAMLEKVLKSARSGDVVSAMVGFICKDGSTGSGLSTELWDDVAKSYGVASNLAQFAHRELYRDR